MGEFKQVIRAVRTRYGNIPAAEFGPRAFKAVRDAFVAAGWCRRLVNRRANLVRHVFKWAAGEEMVPGGVCEALRAVPGLQAGRTPAPEADPVGPVPDAAVAKTLPHLTPTVAAMAQVQRLSGMRPGEVCLLRPCDLDRSGPVWVYRPPYHKLAYRGKERVITLGPKAQAVLTTYGLPADPADYVFSPRRAVAEHRAARAAARKTKRPANTPPEVVKPTRSVKSRRPAERYTASSYGQAVARACDRAGTSRWHPNQLRHAHATAVRRAFGLEAARVSLGHDHADTTLIYAEAPPGREKSSHQPTPTNQLPLRCENAVSDPLGLDVPEDLRRYMALTESGRFYEYPTEKAKGRLTREQIKRKLFKHWLFCRDHTRYRLGRLMDKEFPTVTGCVAGLKRDDHRHAAHFLQRVESGIIVQKVVRRFMARHPGEWVGTIHDSVLVKGKHAAEIRRIVREEFARFAITPTVKTDRMERRKGASV